MISFPSFPTHILSMSRLSTNGLPDSTFTPFRDVVRGVTPLDAKPKAMRILRDGRIALITRDRALRFTANGGLDPTYAAPLVGSPGYPLAPAIADDGKIWFFTNVSSPRLKRFDSEGNPDPSFLLQNGFAPTDVTAICPLDDGRAYLAGNFTQIDTVARAKLARVNAAFETPNPPSLIGLIGPSSVRAGDSFTFTLQVAGSPPLRYSVENSPWSDNPVITISNAQRDSTQVRAIGAGDVIISTSVSPPITPSAPVIARQPGASPIQVRSGESITLNVDTSGSDPRTYQWYRNGEPVAGATNTTLTIARATPANRGDYTVVIRNALGVVTSTPVHIGVDELPRLANLSIRGWVGAGENALITGFVITGTGGKSILLRGIGPALAAFGVADALSNPKLTLFDSGGRVVAENAGWSASQIGDAFDRTHAFALPAGSPDAALVANLAPGAYTAQLSSVGNATGTGLLELYEINTDPVRMTNLSARARVLDTSNVAIPGIVVNGMLPVKLLVRAVGPALTSFGIQDALADPTLSLVGNDGTIVASNNNWADNVDIIIASSTIGTFPLPFGSRDAALITTVAPGTYTALVRGANDTTGVVLIEVYELP